MKDFFMKRKTNILQVLLLILIGIFCDTVFMGITGRFILPEQAYSIPDIYKINKIYRIMYNNLPIVYSIFCTIYIIFFKIYLFPKIVTEIEKNKTEVSFFIQNIHKNNKVIIYIIVFLMFCSFVFNEILSDLFYVNKNVSFIFSIPFNYIIIYLYWTLKDMHKSDENIITNNALKENIYPNLIKYVIITNCLTIIGAVAWIGLLLLSVV